MKTLLFITLLGAVVLAQTPAPVPVATPESGAVRLATPGTNVTRTIHIAGAGAGAGTVAFISAANVGPVIAGAPYSAEAVNETVQTLADGNRIVDKNSTKQYRDSQGRERRELGDLIVISDPVAKVRYTLHPQTKTAEKMTEREGGNFFLAPFETRAVAAPTVAAIPSTFAFEQRVEMGPSFVTSTVLNGVREVAPQVGGPIELLPSRNIEGVIANGTKSVRTIPVGEVGNERPIEIVDESWTSPELGVTVLTTHSDPRSGTTTYKLTNINRTEPQRSLFEVPADYTLVEGPHVDVVKEVIRKKEE